MKQLNLTDIGTDAPHLIEASAGTGKTWTIAALYTMLLLERRLKPDEILVVTYTKAATAELCERIRARIAAALDLFATGRQPLDGLEELLLQRYGTDSVTAERLLTRALYGFDDAAIHTIHSFCQRALTENAFESGSLFDTEMISDQSGIVREVCDDFWRRSVLAEPADFLAFLTAGGWTPEKLCSPFKGHYQNPDLAVIPPAVPVDPAPLVAGRSRLFSRLAELWRTDREILTALLNGAGLSQTSYKPARIEAAAGELDAWFTGDAAGPHCDGLTLFTSAAIKKAEKKGAVLPAHPFFDLAGELQELDGRLEEVFRERLIACRQALHVWLKQELPQRKRSRNLRCFDDLLLDLHSAVAGAGGDRLASGMAQRFRAALIDEFQDTDPLQWRIFARLAGIGTGTEYPLYVIGDPKQAIYSFRGADIHAYLSAANAIREDHRHTLDTNRRSSRLLVSAVNRVFGTCTDPFLSPGITFTQVHSGRDPGHNLFFNGCEPVDPLRFRLYQRQDQSRPESKSGAVRGIARGTTEEIVRLLDGSCEIVNRFGRRPLAPGDIAVLVRTHNQADLIQETLREAGVPSVQHGSATIFQSGEARDLLRVLRAVHEPSRERLLREALLGPALGLSANDLLCGLDESADQRSWEEWLQRFAALRETTLRGGVIALVGELLGECGVRSRILARSGGERILTNLMHCAELLHQAEREQALGLEGLIAWLERRIAAGEEDETALLRLETDDQAVRISTIHASKGLEYPVVFLPFVWEDPPAGNDRVLFHNSGGGLTLDLGSGDLDSNREMARAEQAAEAVRLLYVALTRAEFLCYVTWGNIGKVRNSPLCRFLHPDAPDDPKYFNGRSDADILADLRQLSGEGSGISTGPMPAGGDGLCYHPPVAAPPTLSCRTLSTPVRSDWRVSSFSSLTATGERAPQPRDYDALRPAAVEPAVDNDGGVAGTYSIHRFPRGAAAGTCLHEIFERLDFTDSGEEQISRVAGSRLLAHGYDPAWLPAVAGMIRAITTAPLIADDPDFSLSRLKPGGWRCELEFFLPVAALSPERLQQLFAGLVEPERHGGFTGLLRSLTFRPSTGMLQGFIDMVFEHGGRYYLIDWKSNHLGFSYSDYTPAAITGAMAEHAYILQYHLYSLALDRHLRLHVPGYRYETHFGGAIYLFLRGVNPHDRTLGFYHDKPSAEFLQRAGSLLL